MRLSGAEFGLKLPRRYLHEGEEIPYGYGIAWIDFLSDRAVVMPLGINWTAGALRWLWIEIGRGPRMQDRFYRAYVQGWNDCIQGKRPRF